MDKTHPRIKVRGHGGSQGLTSDSRALARARGVPWGKGSPERNLRAPPGHSDKQRAGCEEADWQQPLLTQIPSSSFLGPRGKGKEGQRGRKCVSHPLRVGLASAPAVPGQVAPILPRGAGQREEAAEPPTRPCAERHPAPLGHSLLFLTTLAKGLTPTRASYLKAASIKALLCPGHWKLFLKSKKLAFP